ncbi:hypothetical protein HY490_00465 [Candidatus Woesearchaeota archaeon]|nr:hypothetical protein [Candidatus Woesearchaeota archaeon]
MPKKDEGRYEQLKEKIEALNGKLSDLKGQATDYVAEHPVQSTAVAFGAGLLAGAVLTALLRKR